MFYADVPYRYTGEAICSHRFKRNVYTDEAKFAARWFGNTVGGVREIKLFSIFNKKHEEFIQNQECVIEKQKQMDMLSQWNSVINLVMVQLLSTVLYILSANLVLICRCQ